MKKLIFTFFVAFLATTSLLAQTRRVGINTTSPQATMDVRATTTDTKTLRVTRSNGTESVVVDNSGRIGVGVSSPVSSVDIKSTNGWGSAIKIQDGSEGQGKFLMSDATGRGYWETIPLVALPPMPSDPRNGVKSQWIANSTGGKVDVQLGTTTYPAGGQHYSVPVTGWYVMQSRWFYTESGATDIGTGYAFIQINEDPQNRMDGPVYQLYEYRAAVNNSIGISPPSGSLIYLRAGAKYYVHCFTRNTAYPGTGERNFTFYLLQETFN